MKEAQVKQAEVQVEIAEMQQDIQNEAQEQAAYDQQIAQDLWEWATNSDIDMVKQMLG